MGVRVTGWGGLFVVRGVCWGERPSLGSDSDVGGWVGRGMLVVCGVEGGRFVWKRGDVGYVVAGRGCWTVYLLSVVYGGGGLFFGV